MRKSIHRSCWTELTCQSLFFLFLFIIVSCYLAVFFMTVVLNLFNSKERLMDKVIINHKMIEK